MLVVFNEKYNPFEWVIKFHNVFSTLTIFQKKLSVTIEQ